MKEPVFSVKNFSVSFTTYESGLRQKVVQAVHNLETVINHGEILAIAGASGSGKSLLAHAIFGILPGNAVIKGDMFFLGEPLTKQKIYALRGKQMALIPQSVSYLNPLMKVGKSAGEKACALFKRYGLDEQVKNLYPHELSGGMARRVLIATAAATPAKLIVADEPTAGLNGTLAHKIMKHLRELAQENRAILLITHDLFLAAQYADIITVIRDGETIETVRIEDLKSGQAKNDYTRKLWRALPENQFFSYEKETLQ